jgi:hypothetical protein
VSNERIKEQLAAPSGNLREEAGACQTRAGQGNGMSHIDLACAVYISLSMAPTIGEDGS